MPESPAVGSDGQRPPAGPAGVHRPVLMADMLVTALGRAGDRPALHIDGRVLTARELAGLVSRYEQALRSLGVGPGTVLATLAPNSPELVALMCAELLVGSTSTSLHPLGSLEDHAYVLADSGADALVFDPAAHGDRVVELAARHPGLRLIALGPSERGADLVADAATMTPRPLHAPAADPAAVQRLSYTGGTTGRPKGVVHTFASRAAVTQLMTTEWEWPHQPRHLVCAPLSHAGGTAVLPVLLRAGSLWVLPRFDAEQVLAAIETHRITSVMLVPTMIYALLDHPRLDRFDLSSLETVFYGASAMAPSRLREAMARIGPVFAQFYGQAEAPMTLTVLRRADHDPTVPGRLAACGRPVPWVHVELLDDDCRPVPDGLPGEICVRGPLTMREYLGKPAETAAAFAGGWLHTGDVAVRDADGILTIVDRKKDMVVTGGFNVFPREVEDVVAAHPAVGGVAVVGVPDARWGEVVVAVVVPRPGAAVAAEEIIALVRERKGPVQAPKRVEFVSELPLTQVGKPDKQALRARFGPR
ncbi:AMP-binding protein [Blastococcus sp. SYSU DS0539]